MRVAIAARPAADDRKTGVGYYTWHLLRLLPELDPSTTYIAWYGDAGAGPRLWSARRFSSGVRLPNLVERREPVPQAWLDRFDFPRLEWLVRFDVLFAPNFVPPPTRCRRLVVTVHDLAFRLFPETAPVAGRRWLTRVERALKEASEVITVSESTRRDLLENYPVPPDKVTVVPLGVDAEVFHPPTAQAVEAACRLYGIASPYFVFVGGIEPRKNLPAIVRAFASLPGEPRATLVVVGAGVPWNPRGGRLLRSALDALEGEVRRRVVLTGYVSETDKVALLGGAEALVFPSLYEGFGLPVLEAMSCGTPVLTSDVPALAETTGGAALLVDPRDTDAIAEGMSRLLTNDRLRGDLRSRGLVQARSFSWRETARRTAEVLHRAAEH